MSKTSSSPDSMSTLALSTTMTSRMFESLQRVDTKLVVKMKRSFEQRSVQLLDKLAKHLRARLPPGSIQRMEYVVGSPPSTRTIII